MGFIGEMRIQESAYFFPSILQRLSNMVFNYFSAVPYETMEFAVVELSDEDVFSGLYRFDLIVHAG